MQRLHKDCIRIKPSCSRDLRKANHKSATIFLYLTYNTILNGKSHNFTAREQRQPHVHAPWACGDPAHIADLWWLWCIRPKIFAAFLTDGIGQLGAGMCWCEVTFEFHPNMEDGKRCNNEMLCTYTAYIYIYTCLHIQCNKHIVYIFLRTLEKTNDPFLWMLHTRFCRIWYVNACIGCLECLDRSGRFR